MSLFFSLLPFYLFGNIHCFGMCGPLVMLLGRQPGRFFYFLGRLSSFTLAALIAGEAGAILHLFLKQYYLSEILSLLSGIGLIAWGCHQLKGGKRHLSHNTHPLNSFQRWVSTLLLKEHKWATFLFGFFTVALPCGQTLLVFSACALIGDPWIGALNGFAFALLTTPSLILAMHSLTFFKKLRGYDRLLLGGSALLVGSLAFCRGLAEIGWISHWILNPEASPSYHLVIF